MLSRLSSCVLAHVVPMAVAACVLASVALGQTTGTRQVALIRIHVVDEHGKSVDGVTIAISAADAYGADARYWMTDAKGYVSPLLAPNAVSYDYTARKIGFEPVHGTIVVASADTLQQEIRLTRGVAQALDTVHTAASRWHNMTDYELGADEIAQSKEHLVNAFDAIRYLRPTLLGLGAEWSGGIGLQDGTSHIPGGCTWAAYLWVNGVLQPLGPTTSLDPTQLSRTPRRRDQARRGSAFKKIGPGTYLSPDAPLAMINSAYIEEMHYVDCHHPELGKNGQNALYVTLKPGISFDVEHGAYVKDSVAARNSGAIQ